MSLSAIREQRAAKVAEARSILSAAGDRALTADESAKFDAIKADIQNLEAQETRAQFMAEAERQQPGTPVHGDSRAALESRVSLLDVLQARIDGRALSGAAAEYHAEAERRTGRKAQGVFVPASLLETRVNLTTTAGSLVPTDHRADLYVGPLRDSLVVRNLGVRVLSNLSGDVSIPKYGSGLSAGWVSENEALTESNMTFESVTLRPRHVGALTSWSRQLAQQSNPSIEQLLRDDLAYAIGAEVDRAIITGDGIKQPLGLVNTPGVQTAPLPTDWGDVLAAEQLLAAINARPNAWFTSPGVLSGLRNVLKAASAGSDYVATGSAIGEIPAYVSNAAPAGTAILGDFAQIVLGTWSELDLLINPYETEAFKRGNVLIRAMMTCDVAVRHPEAFVVSAGV
jgi:HK97 family phage major capsid protein